jgi:hypothetical protein
MPAILAVWEFHSFKPDNLRDSILKIPNTYTQRAGGVAQVVQHLPSKCEALSIQTPPKNNKNI